MIRILFSEALFHFKNSEVVVQRGSEKKNVLKHFVELTRKRFCWNLFCSEKVVNACRFFKKETLSLKWCFPVNYEKFLRTPFFIEHSCDCFRGYVLPAVFWKSKKYHDLKKALDFVHFWVKFSIEGVVWVSSRKNSQFFSWGAFFFLFFKRNTYQSALIPQDLPYREKFVVTRLSLSCSKFNLNLFRWMDQLW